VILAHHAGEQLLLGVLSGGATVAGGIAVMARGYVDRIHRWLSRP
jgi:hypothetical protein